MSNDSAHTPTNSAAQSTRLRCARWAVRVSFLFVFLINVQCAISFIIWPDGFAPAYQLSGVSGQAAVAGIGVAFLMWNVTYPAVIVRPDSFYSLGVVVLIQQLVGLVGECLIWANLPSVGYEILCASIARFVIFDGVGLLLMGATFIWFSWERRRTKTRLSNTSQ